MSERRETLRVWTLIAARGRQGRQLPEHGRMRRSNADEASLQLVTAFVRQGMRRTDGMKRTLLGLPLVVTRKACTR
ncbi:hypothetical protein F4827_004564 [Paraburkholderia bannensis]|uniref:Uncharacterized protein n=1 Tax=Paraburkholderia bannensis TaxID=765414 RepID=A0A7W9U2G3_9BURK|nr:MULTISPECIES: hypothetical protein [Paraburkholderia]MBB3259689.1 hypothetical protein [Paraburkholderia sp. WP4_3_2]MBB6104705.1 hypothetical protein [Paraburkholderia bannensis]